MRADRSQVVGCYVFVTPCVVFSQQPLESFARMRKTCGFGPKPRGLAFGPKLRSRPRFEVGAWKITIACVGVTRTVGDLCGQPNPGGEKTVTSMHAEKPCRNPAKPAVTARLTWHRNVDKLGRLPLARKSLVGNPAGGKTMTSMCAPQNGAKRCKTGCHRNDDICHRNNYKLGSPLAPKRTKSSLGPVGKPGLCNSGARIPAMTKR